MPMSDEPPLEERDAISDLAFRALLDWYVASDPWPLADDKSRGVIFGFICAEASKRGYDDWIKAYHDFEPDASDDTFRLYGKPAEVDAVVYVDGEKYLLADNGERQEAVKSRGDAYGDETDHTEYIINDA